MSILSVYQDRIVEFNQIRTTLKKESTSIGLLRILVALSIGIGVYFYSTSRYPDAAIALTSFCLIVFFILLKKHQRIHQELKLYQELIQINKQELSYIEDGVFSFEDGKEFIDTTHAYTYDLDIFGNYSLFQHLNRTGTKIGKKQLADILSKQQADEITNNQEAIQELALKINWRQHYTAKGNLSPDHQDSLKKIAHWNNQISYFNTRRVYRHLSIILPVVLMVCGFIHVITDQALFYYGFISLFFINLSLFGILLKHIKKEYEALNSHHKILKMYSQLIEHIEKEAFHTEKNKQLHDRLFLENRKASKVLSNLSDILFRLDSMHYGLVSIIFNGLFLYHIHSIYALMKWKKQYSTSLLSWLDVIRTFDAYNSLANFAFNNPHFTYPEVAQEDVLKAEALGHPLIKSGKRICNSIDFKQQKFTILTGSNMSGKSTFLRTLGINLILAKTGAPVCAKRFVFYPYEVFLSMRINDSLYSNESFFFAELNRLQHLIALLERNTKTFVLLDEILRGTNSNDKYSGTVGLIKKLIERQAIGIIATHDLSVTEMTKQYPHYLNNKCFEVEIKEHELYFDYLLKEGVCEKMSASFLMKKMNIIE